MRKRFITALIIIGFSGIVAQVLLLRELLIKFYGNELSIGIILANWLILEAAGAFFLGKRIERVKKKIEAFAILQLIFSLSLPLVVYLTRILNTIIGLMPGEGLGIAGIFWSSLILLFPVCLPHGALFTFGCRIYSSFCKDSQGGRAIGRVYIYDALGTLLGGIVFTYLLIRYFHSFEIAFGISLLNILACLILLRVFLKTAFIFLLLNVFLIIKADDIHWLSLRKQWPKQNVVYYQNSVYGNVAVTEKGKQYTFFSNGIPIFSSPTPDIITVEEFGHFSLLSHPAPRKILVISGGAGGLINEVLKHPVERIDYCELNPLIIKAVKLFSTPITKAELSDPRVKINYVDGRFFLKNTNNKYDVILVGISNPSDLQTNRLFTKEFFLLAKHRLNEDGILAVNLPGSLSYLSDELRKLNTSIYDTLKQNLPFIKIIPGDINIFLGSTSEQIEVISPALLARRLKLRNLKTSLITAKYIEYKLGHQWLSWFQDSIKETRRKINTDFHPIGVFYSLSYWNALFSPHTQKIFKLFERIDLKFFIIPVIIFVLIYLITSLKNKKIKRYALPYAIIATGFCGIIFDLVLIFAFQILYGFVYYWVGLLITAFMVGLTLGGLAITQSLERIKDDFKTFLKLEAAIIIFSFGLPFILIGLRTFHQVIFLILSFISGFLVGVEFPLANKIYLKTSPSISRTAGLLYAGDLLGGWLGGILGGVALMPILGLFKTCMLMVILKISSFIILLGKRGVRGLFIIFITVAIFTTQLYAEESSQERYTLPRERMVQTQIIARGISDERVLHAMLKVERHKFVPVYLRAFAYNDQPLPIGEGQTISQPYIVALMTELLRLDGDEKVLEIGTGSGYQAAILAELTKEVYTIEILKPLAKSADKLLKDLGYENIKVKCGDGFIGWEEYAPFDGIIVTCAPEKIPQPLIEQLAEGGRMVIPVGDIWQELKLLEKKKGKIVSRSVIPVRFVPMTGKTQEK